MGKTAWAALGVALGLGAPAGAEESRLHLTGDHQQRTVTCAPETEVVIEGASNDYRIQGVCKLISVSGTSNQVRVQSLGRLTVEGEGNVILWTNGLTEPEPPALATSASPRTP